MEQIAALTLPLVDGKPQVIIPAGKFEAPKGSLNGFKGPWFLTDDDGNQLVDKMNNIADGVDILIDYDHQSLLARENGKPAPAAGWIMRGSFSWNPELGLIANTIKWTEDAAKMIRDGAYRYLSPVFSFNQDGIPLALQSVAITNMPALTNLQELAINSRGGLNMPESKKDTDTQADSETKVEVGKPIESKQETVPLAIASNPQPKDELAPAQHPMIAALTNQVAALGAENAKLRGELAQLQNQLADSARDGLIQAALSDGRLLPAMTEWAKSINIVALSDYLSKAQPIAALTGLQTKSTQAPQKEKDKSLLNDEELAVCKQMNIDPKVFAATRDKEQVKWQR